MKITDIAALILAVATIGRFLIKQEEDEEPQVQGACKACQSNPAPCCDTHSNPVPPRAVQAVALSALERRRSSPRRSRPGGTAIGVARGRDISNGRNLSPLTLQRMYSYFQRHDTPAERTARRDPMSPASISWDLWGGDQGRRWINELRK